jgi:hypothetical protein
MKFKGGTGWAREIWIVEPSPQPGEGSRMDTADNPRRISKNEKTTQVSCSSAYFQRQHRSGPCRWANHHPVALGDCPGSRVRQVGSVLKMKERSALP